MPPESSQSPARSRPKLLVLELWGLGDLTLATTLLQAAAERYEVTVVGKAHARALLGPSFPEVEFIPYDAPWTAYRGKYWMWKWRWDHLFSLLAQLRRRRFDAAVSVRSDPRDHLLMRIVSARERYGFPVRGSEALLTHSLARSRPKQHRVEDWREIGRGLGLSGIDTAAPRLDHAQYRSSRVDELLAGLRKPLVCLHAGARIPVRRWPEKNFAYVIEQMRREYDFHLAVIPDPDGYGQGLSPLVDSMLTSLEVPDMVDVLGRADLVLCNDSGPGHIAAACGRPTFVVFGPGDPDCFRPWGETHHLVIEDICKWRPCYDYCKFPEPYCMTKLLPEIEWPKMRAHLEALITRGVLPRALRREEGPVHS